MQTKDLAGKTALITGCNRGIGLEVLRLFAANGANIICCVRKEDECFTSIMSELASENGVEIGAVYTDYKNEESVKEAFKPLLKNKMKIDILVNNIGVGSGSLFNMTTMETLKEVFQINFFSQVLVVQMVSKLMIRQRSGTIINVGSVAGLDNFAGFTSYGSSKAAFMEFTKIIAKELAPYNIRVNAIAPGITDTGMAGTMDERTLKEMIDRSCMKRMGNPEEIANLMLFLASDKSSFITGQIIRIDGGM